MRGDLEHFPKYNPTEALDALWFAVDNHYAFSLYKDIIKLDDLEVIYEQYHQNVKTIPIIFDFHGDCLLSTNQGILSGKEARQKKVGGEIICEIY